MSHALAGRPILALGIDNEIGGYLCLRLALDGYAVYGIGENVRVLSQIAREVNDVRGRFTWSAAPDPRCARTWMEAATGVSGQGCAVLELDAGQPLPQLVPGENPVDSGRFALYAAVRTLVSSDPTLADAATVRVRLDLEHTQLDSPSHDVADGPSGPRFPANAAAVVAEAIGRLLSQSGPASRCEVELQFMPEQIRIVAPGDVSSFEAEWPELIASEPDCATLIVPRCASTIRNAIDMPSPVPLCLVVKNGSKI